MVLLVEEFLIVFARVRHQLDDLEFGLFSALGDTLCRDAWAYVGPGPTTHPPPQKAKGHLSGVKVV